MAETTSRVTGTIKMKNRRGYILLETLMAILILSVGVIMLARAILLPARAAVTCRHTNQAYRLIDQKFDECRLGAARLQNSRGEIIVDGELYRWTVTVDTDAERLKPVSVEVEWDEYGVGKSVKMSAVIGNFADPGESDQYVP